MKKQQHGFGLISLVVVLALLGVVAFTAFRITTQENKKQSEVARPAKPYREVIDQTRRSLSSSATLIEYRPENGQEFAYMNYRLDGYDFYASLNSVNNQVIFQSKVTTEPLSEFATQEEIDKQNSDLDTVLKPHAEQVTAILGQSGFREVTDQNRSLLYDGESLYASENDVCLFSKKASLVLTCASIADFKTSADMVKEFVALYQQGLREKVADTDFSNDQYMVDRQGTGNNGAEYAYIRTGNAIAYFYKESTGWKYYGSSQQGVSCDATFPSTTAKDAFATTCTDYTI